MCRGLLAYWCAEIFKKTQLAHMTLYSLWVNIRYYTQTTQLSKMSSFLLDSTSSGLIECDSFYHYPMTLKVGPVISCSYHNYQSEPLNLLIFGLNILKYLAHMIDRSLNFVCLLGKRITHRVVSKRQIKVKGPTIGCVKMDNDARKTFKLANVSSHLLVHLNFSFFFKVLKKWKDLSPTQEIKKSNEIEKLIFMIVVELLYVGRMYHVDNPALI